MSEYVKSAQLVTFSSGLFRSVSANFFYTAVLPIIAIATALIAHHNPNLFEIVLLLDLWLLGYHHVIATYTRLLFDKQSFIEHKKLIFVLPFGVVAGVLTLYSLGGAVIIASAYLYWQWYHYTRQSEGISKAYCFKAGFQNANETFARFSFYLFPIASFIVMLSRQETTFLGMPIFQISVSSQVAWSIFIFALLMAACWMADSIIKIYKGQLGLYYFIYNLSHYSIYYFSYVYIDDITHGWLAINIWHNAQYLLFVWLFNKNKYKNGVDRKSLILSYLSQPNRVFLYFGVCLVISILVYKSLGAAIDFITDEKQLAWVLLVYATINFHHYIVDSAIWKLRSKKIQANI